MWLADAIDPATGELASLRRGRHPVDAAVLWQFQVELGSGAALGQNGHRIRKIRKAVSRMLAALATISRHALGTERITARLQALLNT